MPILIPAHHTAVNSTSGVFVKTDDLERVDIVMVKYVSSAHCLLNEKWAVCVEDIGGRMFHFPVSDWELPACSYESKKFSCDCKEAQRHARVLFTFHFRAASLMKRPSAS